MLKKILVVSLISCLIILSFASFIKAIKGDEKVIKKIDDKITAQYNDFDLGSGLFQFEFIGKWGSDSGLKNLFHNGDEHWTTKAQFGSDYASVNFRFIGNQMKLYGHTTPSGGIADVLIDGKKVGEVDYYTASRINKNLLFTSEQLEDGKHTFTLKMSERYNKKANGNLESGIDYIEVTCSASEMIAQAIKMNKSSITIEEGVTYESSFNVIPSYATTIPAIIWASEDESVAMVNQKGEILGIKEGTTTVTATYKDTNVSDSTKVKIIKQTSSLIGYMVDDNIHYFQEDYQNFLESSYNLDAVTSKQWSGMAWKNDTISSRFELLTKGKEIKNVRITASDFATKNGDKISGNNLDIYFIKDVYAHTSNMDIPDVMYKKDIIDIPAGTLQAVWVNINVPKDATAGIYTGTINIISECADKISFDYNLEVLDIVQPNIEDVDIQMELWQYPYSAERYYSGKTTSQYYGKSVSNLYYIHLSDNFEDILRSQVQLYKRAGGKAITVTIVEDPWNSQTPDPYPSMVKWKKTLDGTFSFDYTDFDKWVQFNMNEGVNGQIKSFSLSCWGNRVTYYDEASNSVKTKTPKTNSDEWKNIWGAFLKSYVKHLEEKGWFDITYISMDERPYEEVKATVDFVESITNEKGESLKISLAVFQWETKDLFDRIDDLSLAIGLGNQGAAEIAEVRRAKGLLTTLYTCGAQNSAIANEPGESAYSIWYTYKCNTDGFLRWALDSFNDNPLISSYHLPFAAGDIYLIYPDEKDAKTPIARTSPRFEKLTEGVRDVAKVKYLKKVAPELINDIDALIESLGTKNNGNMPLEVKRVRSELLILTKNFVSKDATNNPTIMDLGIIQLGVMAAITASVFIKKTLS